MIGCMLHNEATGRYHPIFFRPAYGPGGNGQTSDALRHRSFGHHTSGFDTLEEAQANAEETCKPGSGHAWDGTVYFWDGEETPAMTLWFPNSMVLSQFQAAPETPSTDMRLG